MFGGIAEGVEEGLCCLRGRVLLDYIDGRFHVDGAVSE